MLILEGAQAGLSWETVLKRRQGYCKAFYNYDPAKIIIMSDNQLDTLMKNSDIIRNKLKIYSVRQNAQVFLKIQKEFGSFAQYIWGFVNFKPIVSEYNTLKDVPITTLESDALAKNLKNRGMTFVGSTIIYAYMQAIGMVNDHVKDCWLFKKS